MIKKVLLTGASGFIGSHAIPFLLARRYEVHAVSTRPQMTNHLIRQHSANLLDAEATQALVKKVKPTHLLHFAWYAIPGKFWTSPENLNWIKASIHLLQQFAESGGQRVVMSGTCAEYDWNTPTGICIENETPLNPSTLYGTCKAALYQIMKCYCHQIGLSSAWGRIFHLYGPHEYPQRLVPDVILNLIKKQTAKTTLGRQIRDFMHVEDVANAFVTLLDSEVQGSVNIASGEAVALKDVITCIADLFQARELIHYGALPTSASDPAVILANTKRLRNELNWSPKYTLQEGLSHSIEWWKQAFQTNKLAVTELKETT